MRNVWLALAFVGTLAVGLLLELLLGAFGAGGEQGSAPSPPNRDRQEDRSGACNPEPQEHSHP